jgi:hypothetical protein
MKNSKSDPAVSYDDFKTYEGRRYTGMKIGRSHKWHYDPGEWKETKITPDLWQISYAVTKRRAGHAPEGSGVPVGTEYHWYIAAHQNVRKINANDYTTSLAGLKFKIAHKRANAATWNVQPATQRQRLITFLKGVIDDLERSSREQPADAAAARASTNRRAPAPSRPLPRPARRARTAPGSRDGDRPAAQPRAAQARPVLSRSASRRVVPRRGRRRPGGSAHPGGAR